MQCHTELSNASCHAVWVYKSRAAPPNSAMLYPLAHNIQAKKKYGGKYTKEEEEKTVDRHDWGLWIFGVRFHNSCFETNTPVQSPSVLKGNSLEK